MIRGTEHFEHREAAVLVSAVPPLVPKTAANPEGLPLEVPAGLRADKDWGEGPVVTFSHGWPLSSDAWDGQMLFLAQNST